MQMEVAPPAGAWIETRRFVKLCRGVLVAPPAGAWIETTNLMTKKSCKWKSLPPRERGLKQGVLSSYAVEFWSLPPRERGLKQILDKPYRVHSQVAPPAGAWIETI